MDFKVGDKVVMLYPEELEVKFKGVWFDPEITKELMSMGGILEISEIRESDGSRVRIKDYSHPTNDGWVSAKRFKKYINRTIKWSKPC